jgi:hypothetical protein
MTYSKRILCILPFCAAAAVLPCLAAAGGIAALEPLGSYPADPDPALFGEGGAETAAYDALSGQLLITNRALKTLDVVDIHTPSAPALTLSVDLSAYGKEPTYVDVHDGLAAVTISNAVKTENGVLLIIDIDEMLFGTFEPDVVAVGASPDGVRFTPDGAAVLVINEGEPNDEYTVDPEGSVSIVRLGSLSVRTAGFGRFNSQKRRLQRRGIRIFGPGATVAQDLEPENLAISADAKTAWVTLQENNAMAIVDIPSARVEKLVPLGYKMHLAPKNALDASDKDDAINIRPWPVFGMYQPDGIAAFEACGRTYLVTANEGDARDYVFETPDGEEVVSFSEEARVKDLTLSPLYEQFWPGLQESENLGRLKTTTAPHDGKIIGPDGEEIYNLIYSYGARSLSVWSAEGRQLFDSGDEMEQIIAGAVPDHFNTDQDENEPDKRSDDKGPEPEGVVVGEVDGVPYAFVTLERIGGVMAYDLSNPAHPVFAAYGNHRYFEGDPESGTSGDLGPEGVTFIPANESPICAPLVVIANEVSGTTTIYQIVTER